MTEYWVSQGNKWCDFCKIYIANNAASIRTHEAGKRHKENVSKRLNDIRKENASKEKERQQALKDMDRIEAQARRSYQKDLESQEKVKASATATDSGSLGASAKGEWVHDQETGYRCNATLGCYHDPKSGLYFSQRLGKWTSQLEALKDSAIRSNSLEIKPGKPPGPGSILKEARPLMPVKGKASSLQVGNRKRPARSESISKEEEEALKAREAAKKRVQEREKAFLGLYQS
ncbi:hypothetical protein KP509_26G063000 [Ceratopteris richardii]|uniref:Matrin-type domain-containing protein n=1 Tax=Ceratopteris richardii TaxID=49495 RepID=A0A8T2RNB6_CERRI|nr:hypothetical protein KP509_26G063000 [Ceratopteris richardii]